MRLIIVYVYGSTAKNIAAANIYTEKQTDDNEIFCGDIDSCSCTGDQSLTCMPKWLWW